MLLPGEHVLDMGTDFRALRVGPGDALGHRPARWFLLVDVAGEHALGEEGLVLLRAAGGIGPDARSGVVPADRNRQPSSVMGIGGASIPGADQPVRPVDADMVLVAEHGNGKIDRPPGLWGRLGIATFLDLDLAVFDRPARIAILLPGFGRLPVRR